MSSRLCHATAPKGGAAPKHVSGYRDAVPSTIVLVPASYPVDFPCQTASQWRQRLRASCFQGLDEKPGARSSDAFPSCGQNTWTEYVSVISINGADSKEFERGGGPFALDKPWAVGISYARRPPFL